MTNESIHAIEKPKEIFVLPGTILVANWKPYRSMDETIALIQQLESSQELLPHSLFIALPYNFLANASQTIASKCIVFGATHLNSIEPGSFTENSAVQMVKDAGGKFALVGNAEQRNTFNENNHVINAKI